MLAPWATGFFVAQQNESISKTGAMHIKLKRSGQLLVLVAETTLPLSAVSVTSGLVLKQSRIVIKGSDTGEKHLVFRLGI